MSTVYKPVQWIPISLFGLIVAIINIAILKIEFNKRNRSRKTIIFITNYIRYGPIICIISAIIFGTNLCLSFFPPFCYISKKIYTLSLTFQGCCLSFYQLSRLHYCFANSNIHSNKGYPNWLFVIMYSIGIIIIINASIIPWIIASPPKYCSLTSQTEYKFTGPNDLENGLIPLWAAITGIVYVCHYTFHPCFELNSKNIHKIGTMGWDNFGIIFEEDNDI